MAEFPGQGLPPTHRPPHVPEQSPVKPIRKRRPRAPASITKPNRPLTRFYCNDCKKKFRSQILANRNNNAVQHYCAMYGKIITRKVDSHSNKCKADHGMGPCVVKRTDNAPDSDGEDETKLAYYADKGKRPRRHTTGAFTKKRKRSDDDQDDTYEIPNGYKRLRRDHNLTPNQSVYYPPHSQAHHGYYHPNGYMHSVAYPQYAPYDNVAAHAMPPPPDYPHEDISGSPSIPMPLDTNNNGIPPPVDNELGQPPMDMPPPPALEALDLENESETENENENEIESDYNGEMNGIKNETVDVMANGAHSVSDKRKCNASELLVEVNGNSAGALVTIGGSKEQQKKNNNNNEEKEKEKENGNGSECINEEDDDIPDLTMPEHSLSPPPVINNDTEKEHNGNHSKDVKEQKEEEVDDDEPTLEFF